MKKKIKVLTDSSCDLPHSLIEQHDIEVIPLNIQLGDKSYVDGKNISANEILKWSHEKKKTPKTSAPSLKTVYDIVEELRDEDREAIFFGISSKISTTCNEMELAIKNLNASKIRVVDSKSLSGGIALMVLKACDMANRDCTLEDIYKYSLSMADRVNTSFVIDTLEHLYYGGRCNAVSMFISSSLKLKPCIHLKDGKMVVGKKYRGSNKKALLQYADDIIKDIEKINKERVLITYTHKDENDEAVQSVFQKINEQKYFDEVLLAKASGVITSHGGPNTLGIFYENT